MLDIAVFDGSSRATDYVASLIMKCVTHRPQTVLGIATGSTPSGVYRALWPHRHELRDITAYALDEYVGLPSGHPQSFASVVDREVTTPLELSPGRVHVPNGSGGDPVAEAARYEREILSSGGVDLQLLGVGTNGHIAFNEPGSAHTSRTREVTLAEQTRLDNSRFFETLDDVPRQAITQGIGTILEARQLIVMAFGNAKAAAIASAIEEPMSERSPLSAIRRHSNVVVVLDKAAASELHGRNSCSVEFAGAESRGQASCTAR